MSGDCDSPRFLWMLILPMTAFCFNKNPAVRFDSFDDITYFQGNSSSLPIFKTAFHVIVHHTSRLHVCVTDRRADEFEAALLQVLGQGVGLRRSRPDGFPGHAVGIAQR